MSTNTRRARSQARRAYLAVRRTVSAATLDGPRGIETSRDVDLGALGLAHADRVAYEPSGWLDLRRVLSLRDVRPGDVFLDCGCGKGRVVLQAAAYPFRRVIGVEISEQLSRVARANVEARRERLRCREVEIVTCDITRYVVPDDVTHVYLYNPFRGDTFQALLDALVRSVDAAPRPLRVIYRTPMEHERIMATGRARVVKSAKGLRPGRGWAEKMSIRTYEISPRPVR